MFKGNHKDLNKDACDFMHTYGQKCYHEHQYEIDDIKALDLMTTFLICQDSGAGLDGWHASDLKYLSLYACSIIADFYNAIERGALWPARMMHTRAVFLSKDEGKTDDPMAYRILKVSSVPKEMGGGLPGCRTSSHGLKGGTSHT